LLFIFNFITLGIRLICLEVQKQIMRQLVTFNARQKEQGEYLHTIMMIVSNIHDTQKNLIVSPSLGSNQQFEKIYKLLLISTNDELNIFKGALTDDNILYDQIVSIGIVIITKYTFSYVFLWTVSVAYIIILNCRHSVSLIL